VCGAPGACVRPCAPGVIRLHEKRMNSYRRVLLLLGCFYLIPGLQEPPQPKRCRGDTDRSCAARAASRPYEAFLWASCSHAYPPATWPTRVRAAGSGDGHRRHLPPNEPRKLHAPRQLHRQRQGRRRAPRQQYERVGAHVAQGDIRQRRPILRLQQLVAALPAPARARAPLRAHATGGEWALPWGGGTRTAV
jgi:hypothetical protein